MGKEKDLQLEVIKRVGDIKAVCMDRLDAITPDGLPLEKAFRQIVELLSYGKVKEEKKEKKEEEQKEEE